MMHAAKVTHTLSLSSVLGGFLGKLHAPSAVAPCARVWRIPAVMRIALVVVLPNRHGMGRDQSIVATAEVRADALNGDHFESLGGFPGRQRRTTFREVPTV